MQPISKLGYKATCDNFFTSLDFALHLANQKCCIVGTVRQNEKKLPEVAAAQKYPIYIYSNSYCYFDFITVQITKIGSNNEHIVS